MQRPCISTMNSAIENVDIERPLTDILWYAMLDNSPTHDQKSSIVENCWSESGDRKMVLFDLLDENKIQSSDVSWETEYWDDIPSPPLSVNDKRDNVLNALSIIPTQYPKNIGPMLYFVAETTDAKLDSIKTDITILFDSINATTNIKDWINAERQHMELLAAQIRTDMQFLREESANIRSEITKACSHLPKPQKRSWIMSIITSPPVIAGLTILFILSN